MQAGQNQADLANSILPPDKRVPDVRAAPGLVSGSSSTAKPKFIDGKEYTDAQGNKAIWNEKTQSWKAVPPKK